MKTSTKKEPTKREHRRDAMLSLRVRSDEKLRLLAYARAAGAAGNLSAGMRWALCLAEQATKAQTAQP